MQVPPALQDALKTSLGALAADLTAAGHPHRGLSLDGPALMTNDAQGNPVELTPAAQAFVGTWTPPAPPSAPNWGADLLSDGEMMAQLATAVQQIRQYRALDTPTAVQRKAYEDLLGRVALHYLRTRFPQL